jgi:hypothetical protein
MAAGTLRCGALDQLSGTENLEERFDLDARTVDGPAGAYLRSRYKSEMAGS